MSEQPSLPAPTTPARPHQLDRALHDLKEIMDEAAEEGYELPTKSTLRYVRRALFRAHDLCRNMLYDVAPLEDGSIMVQGTRHVDGRKHTAMIQCKPDGGAICSYFAPNRRSRQAFYDSADVMLEDCGFLPSALLELPRPGEHQWMNAHIKSYVTTAYKITTLLAVASTAERRSDEREEETSDLLASCLPQDLSDPGPSSRRIYFLAENRMRSPDAPKQLGEHFMAGLLSPPPVPSETEGL